MNVSNQSVAALGYGLNTLRVLRRVAKGPPQNSNTAGERFIGNGASTPNLTYQELAFHQLAGMTGEQHQNLHDLRFEMFGTLRTREAAVDGVYLPLVEPEALTYRIVQ